VPSSMIFVGLVVMWLLILVPAVARRRQEVARPSVVALSGRVLERAPRRGPDEPDREPVARRDVEVDVRHELEPALADATRTEPDGRPRVPSPRGEAKDGARGRGLDNLDGWTWHDLDGDPDPEPEPTPERRRAGAPRYRPGRGGYDPQAAALTARARYAVRQRVVLILLVLAVGTAGAAVSAVPLLWWAHGGVDLLLVGYLVYLRRQVLVEEAIRRRRSARIGATRRASDSEHEVREPDHIRNGEPDRPHRSGAPGSPGRRADERDARDAEPNSEDIEPRSDRRLDDDHLDREHDGLAGATSAKPAEAVEGPPALPRLQPTPTPPVPIGTSLVEGEDDDPALHDLESVTRPDYRRASGQ
jgi:hypothetical protein